MGTDSLDPAGDPSIEDLARRIDAALPQTQCTRCGFPDCASYAQAIAEGRAGINQCPPGGDEGIQRLSVVTGQAIAPLDASFGSEGPVTVAVIDENWCIGCTLCIKVCPTDAILGSNKRMHTVIEPYCTGCELCIPVCPVDCISLESVSGPLTGWAGWSENQAQQARRRYDSRQLRLETEKQAHDTQQLEKAQSKLDDLSTHSTITDPSALERKRQMIEAAIARAKTRRNG